MSSLLWLNGKLTESSVHTGSAPAGDEPSGSKACKEVRYHTSLRLSRHIIVEYDWHRYGSPNVRLDLWNGIMLNVFISAISKRVVRLFLVTPLVESYVDSHRIFFRHTVYAYVVN